MWENNKALKEKNKDTDSDQFIFNHNFAMDHPMLEAIIFIRIKDNEKSNGLLLSSNNSWIGNKIKKFSKNYFIYLRWVSNSFGFFSNFYYIIIFQFFFEILFI